MPEIAGQRLRRIGLTRGDIGGCLQPGKIRPETEPLGWGGRIRTSAWRNQNPYLSYKKQWFTRQNRGNPASWNQRLTRYLSNPLIEPRHRCRLSFRRVRDGMRDFGIAFLPGDDRFGKLGR